MAEGDRTKGSSYWALNSLRIAVYPRLLDDLNDLEHSGLPGAVCNEIQATLKEALVHIQGTISESELSNEEKDQLTKIASVLEELYNTYYDWNSFDEQQTAEAKSHRRNRLAAMRDKRSTFAQLMRGFKAPVGLKKNRIDRIYVRFSSLCTSSPVANFGVVGNKLPNLHRVVKKYAAINK